jgi:hypothetical protein
MIVAANRILNESLGASRRVLTKMKIMLVFQPNVLKHSCFTSLRFLINVTSACFTEICVLSSQMSGDSQFMEEKKRRKSVDRVLTFVFRSLIKWQH